MSRPRLHVFIDRAPVFTLAAPASLAARAWLLGVVAVQVVVDEGQVRATLRAHATAAAGAREWPLDRRAVVHIGLSDDEPPPLPPEEEALTLDGAAAKLVLRLPGSVTVATLDRSRLQQSPAARAFGHVYCRWLRDGGSEPGCDLTEFLSLPAGEKFTRRVAQPLAVGDVVSYAFAAA